MSENLQEMLNIILVTILIPVIPLVGTYIRLQAKAQIEALRRKLDLEEENYYLLNLEELITTSVLAVQQTYVEELKEEGLFTKEAQHIAFHRAKEKVMNQLSDKGKEILNRAIKDYNQYIEDQIEEMIFIDKKT